MQTSVAAAISSWSWLILSAVCLAAAFVAHLGKRNVPCTQDLHAPGQHDNEIIYPESESKPGYLSEHSHKKADPKGEEYPSGRNDIVFYVILSTFVFFASLSLLASAWLSIMHDNSDAHKTVLTMFDNTLKSSLAVMSGLIAGRKI